MYLYAFIIHILGDSSRSDCQTVKLLVIIQICNLFYTPNWTTLMSD